MESSTQQIDIHKRRRYYMKTNVARVLFKGQQAMALAEARWGMSDEEFCAMTKTIRAITGTENIIGFLPIEDEDGNDQIVVVEYIGFKATGGITILPEDFFDNLVVAEEVAQCHGDCDCTYMC